MTAFPFNPSNGDTHTIGETSWEYDSTYGVWNKTSGGITGNIGPTGATGADGAAGPTGATGITGADVGLSYTVQAGTPSAGQVYRHHDKIKPSDTDGDGNDVGDYWGAAKIGDHIYYFEDDRTGYEISTITAKTDQTSYWEFTISTVDSSSVPTDTGIPVHLYYVAQGPTGPTGPDGASDVAIFSVSTSPKSSISVGSKTTALYRVPYDSTVQQFDVKVSKTGGFTAAAYIAGSDFGLPETNSISGCCLGVSGLTGSSTVFNVSSLTAGNFLYLDVISNTSGSTQAQAFLTYTRR